MPLHSIEDDLELVAGEPVWFVAAVLETVTRFEERLQAEVLMDEIDARRAREAAIGRLADRLDAAPLTTA